ncbi:MAG TPA: extracellular solute-binding protein [Sphaerochaeta sp.]|mgnify:FL=1|jgi:raffinose/stachyose/melibiose transport system substrate-binding protein|nr:extracellular solute-binding protein [Spirochaetota bacterium]NLV61269.1 ABC transporter substrate-binding protein [Spirochaetales bacterium]HOE83778.1 extracellular solute-binding protein [Sphaerochaeta sp.]HOQ94875.1 extracellular solute-binding protein [Sphaerochaeta sp.]
MKKTLLLCMVALMVVGSPLFAAGLQETAPAKEVYFLNFKPEIADVYETKIAPVFEAETGIKLKVVTAASGTYATTLKSELAKSNPPVIFQTNGPMGLAGSLDYTADLKNTNFYKILSDKSMALGEGGQVLAIPYAVEGYGIIYNDAIMRAYFALPNKAVKINSADEINNFALLKAVVEDMQKNKAALGIQGVFASTSMAAGNDWRWQTHLVNVPLYYELRSKGIPFGTKTRDFDFSYGPQMKNIWDLYLNNSTTAKGLLGAKSVDDAMAEFALGQAAMVQNGNWGASQILGVKGNKVADSDIKFMPIYIGVAGEENIGLCVGTENYLCINKKVSAEQQALGDQFLTWLFSSASGKAFVKNDLMFITPFNTFAENELPTDPLAKEVIRWMNKSGVTSVSWDFSVIPSEEWKTQFGAALGDYINGRKNWAEVSRVATDVWKTEFDLSN